VEVIMTSALAAVLLAAAAQGKAPEFPDGRDWLNTDKPIKLAELKGKVVLLDFWTFCCINCHHVFPDLKRLERKYAKELVVVGVHSAKFANEKETANIRKAVIRHDIAHPVVNDADMSIFKAFKATGWPHFILIDPEGTIYGRTGGEGNYAVLDEHIGKMVKQFDAKIDRKEPTFNLEKAKEKAGALSFPGKILATRDRLVVVDTNHHRILVGKTDGTITDVVGGPEDGRKDGDFRTARFYQPEGVALRDDTLYVADTENHQIRAVDLKSKSVRTLAGTGEQVFQYDKGGEPLKTPLNSPWDVVLDGDRLLIAMAGNHQIWELDLGGKRVGPFSGTGHEKIIDGTHAEAAYSQPSGMSILGGKLFVADSETSAVREVDLDPRGKVRSLVGTGLFDFGDLDGVGEKARLQHCLAVHAKDGKVYVADSYNHKIKVLNPGTREVKSLFGDGKRGTQDQKAWPKEGEPTARFYEPSGLWAVGDLLYVADQNNHSIRVCDLKTGEVRTLEIKLP
jgi:thiol-disulfide isomerase/thioredoxin